ncbi:MAG: hypothetical protein JO352_09265 [Chloroflexi bacterium]|nr:hypothetical protein [Chloroflexota bacterium]MBV9596663.1 hypothetical protein [Chloroflexota bacterium]
MQIEERVPCPRCGFRRVIRHARNAYVCFQCRFGWSAGAEPPPAREIDDGSPAERARLIAYRSAVRAGFYTDWPAQAGAGGYSGILN